MFILGLSYESYSPVYLSNKWAGVPCQEHFVLAALIWAGMLLVGNGVKQNNEPIERNLSFFACIELREELVVKDKVWEFWLAFLDQGIVYEVLSLDFVDEARVFSVIVGPKLLYCGVEGAALAALGMIWGRHRVSLRCCLAGCWYWFSVYRGICSCLLEFPSWYGLASLNQLIGIFLWLLKFHLILVDRVCSCDTLRGRYLLFYL